MGTTVDKSTAPLTVVRTDVEPCRVKLDIEVPLERVVKVYEDTVKAFNQHGRVSGFRPGKVPRARLLRQYASQIDLECRRELIRTAVGEAIEKETIQPETTPRIEDEANLKVSPDRAFVFSISFDVAPTFPLPEYKGIRVSRAAAAVAEDQIDEAITQWLQRQASFEKVERASQAGDLLKVSYEGTLTEAIELPETSRFYLSARDTWLALREPEMIPGTVQGLVGLGASQTRELNVAFPAAFNDKTLAGRTAHYTFTVLEVHGTSVPELTDDLAKTVGAESVAQMRDRVRENLKAQQDRAEDQAVRQQILSSLLANLDIPLPAARQRLASHEAMMRLYDREMRRGTTPDQLAGRQEELRRQAEAEAQHGLRRFYLLERLAKEEKIEPDLERVNDLISYMARSNQVTPKVMIRRLRENGRLDDIVVSVREDMVLERLAGFAEVSGAEGKKE